MIRLALIFLSLLSLPLAADTVKVTSGEHEGFTRLVFDYGAPVDWQVGRNLDGYELQLNGARPAYDLREAFSSIGKSRLAAIWADPNTGALNFGLACACHAMPFEFRPGIVVIDLKDGPPPKGSSFELSLNGETAAPISARKTARPRARPASIKPQDAALGYDWTDAALRDQIAKEPNANPENQHQVLPPDPGLQPLRDSLLQQMARGAAQGVIDMTSPENPSENIADSAFPMAQIRIGDQPGDLLHTDSSVKGNLTAEGAACAADTALNIFEWGDAEQPVSDQFAAALADLTGEFDRPDPEAVARAIRFELYLGFGAEARQLITAFAPKDPDLPLWQSLSYHVDEEHDPAKIFDGQAACDGPAALWALLDTPNLVPGDAVDAGAVRLAFSALPLHLRRQLGPKLAAQFLALGDPASARAVTDSILRAPGDPGAKVALLESNLELHNNAPEKAEEHIAAVLADPGPDQPEALIALTTARVAQRLPIDAKVALELQSLLAEHQGSEDEAALLHATILARAASGDFIGAFAQLDQDSTAIPDVWALAALLATDSDLLLNAVLPADVPMPPVAPDTALKIATRLIDLGMAAPAQRWLDSLQAPDPLLLARAALGQSDGRAAIAALADQSVEDAGALRDQALSLIGQNAERAALLEEMGQADAASVALARAGTWGPLAENGTGLWQDLAARLTETPTAPPQADAAGNPGQTTGPLARAHDLTTAGSETRATVTALLAALPLPKSNSP